MVGNFPSFHLLQVLVTKLVERNYVLVEWSRLLCLDIFSGIELKLLERSAPKKALHLGVLHMLVVTGESRLVHFCLEERRQWYPATGLRY